MMCLSIRRVYPKVPIFLYTDSQTQKYLQPRVKNLNCDLFCEPETLEALGVQYSGVAVSNRFHRVDCIAAKMPCLEAACSIFGNTMFLDSDIIILDEIHEDCYEDLTLSPHYHAVEREKNSAEYGVYNAGYVYAATPRVGKVWDSIYRNRSTFFEQQGMIYFSEYMDTHSFNRLHNIGFWRVPTYFTNWPTKRGPFLKTDDLNLSEVKSLHVHCTNEYNKRADSGLTSVYDQWWEVCKTHMKGVCPELLKEWDDLRG